MLAVEISIHSGSGDSNEHFARTQYRIRPLDRLQNFRRPRRRDLNGEHLSTPDCQFATPTVSPTSYLGVGGWKLSVASEDGKRGEEISRANPLQRSVPCDSMYAATRSFPRL